MGVGPTNSVLETEPPTEACWFIGRLTNVLPTLVELGFTGGRSESAMSRVYAFDESAATSQMDCTDSARAMFRQAAS
jgi:hypothetical protein